MQPEASLVYTEELVLFKEQIHSNFRGTEILSQSRKVDSQQPKPTLKNLALANKNQQQLDISNKLSSMPHLMTKQKHLHHYSILNTKFYMTTKPKTSRHHYYYTSESSSNAAIAETKAKTREEGVLNNTEKHPYLVLVLQDKVFSFLNAHGCKLKRTASK